MTEQTKSEGEQRIEDRATVHASSGATGHRRPLISLDGEDAISSWNDAAAELYGYTLEEIQGKPFSLIHPDDGEGLLAQAKGGACLDHVRAVHKTKGGQYLNVTLSILPRMETSDKITGASVVVHSVSHRTGKLLKEEEVGHWTWAVVENAVEAIITIDEGGIIEYFNPAAEKLLGYISEEVVGQNVSMLAPSPHRENHPRHLSDYMKSGHSKIIGVGREISAQRKDGTQVPVHLAVSEVRFGNKRLFTGTLHDITEQKIAQADKDRLLHELNRRNKELSCLYQIGGVVRSGSLDDEMFRGVLDKMRPATSNPKVTGIRITFDGKVFNNDAFEESPWEVASDIISADRRRGRVEAFFLERPLEVESAGYLEEMRRLVAAVSTLLGEAIERNEAHAKVIQASKLASIGELAAGVAHEINNPVNGIINCADILIRDLDEGTESRKFAELVRQEADRIATIVDNLLTFSHQDRKEYQLARLSDIVESVLTLSRKKLSKSLIELTVDVPSDLPRLRCRSERLQQVVMNLVINGMQALDERYPDGNDDKKLSIVAHVRTYGDEDCIRLTISDHGTGIAPTNMERIFDPFFTTKGRITGTGLGLSVSNGIVKEHGGAITVESDVGRYTRFHVDLPLTPGDLSRDAAELADEGHS